MQNFTEKELLEQIKNLQEELQKIKKQKKYWIVWEEKSENIDKDLLPILEEQKDLRIEETENKPYNLIIEWDNFYALSVLQNTHKNKIDVIYIDPPYNTGNKDFIYNDNYVDKEDSYRHSKWLSFMSKRLELAKNLLKDDWVIFISIDDNEFAQLKLLCDEIFGERNFEWNLIWKTKTAAKWVPTINMLVTNHDYVLVYSKSKNFCFRWEDRDLEKFWNSDNDPRWPWKADNMKSTVSNNFFTITNPENWFSYTKNWAFSQSSIENMIKENKILWPKDENWTPRQKRFLSEMKNETTPLRTLIWEFQSETATNKLKDLFLGEKKFDFPKHTEFMKLIINQASNPNSTILDFFAWSWTTWHAVLELNKEDGWNRQFILCSNRENTKENPEKNICRDITYERNKRVIQGYTNAKWEQVEWLWWNLRYYKTEFIPKNKSIDDLRDSFINKCDDLLCIKENTFTKVNFWEEIPELKIFKNKNNFTVILYDIFYLKKLITLLKLMEDKKINLYIFSQSKNIYEEELEDFTNITFANIPNEILETYKKIFGL